MATYWVKSGTGGTDAGTSWSNAAESLEGLLAAQAIAAGDIIYVHNTHNFSKGAALSLTLPESGTGTLKILCVDGGDATGASLVDGTVGAMTTGAIEQTGANAALTFSGANDCVIYVSGLKLMTGSGGATGGDLTPGSGNALWVYENCDFEINGTAGSQVTMSASTLSAQEFHNCRFKFNGAGQGIEISRGRVLFRGCVVDSTGTSVTLLFQRNASVIGVSFTAYGCDFSNCTSVWTTDIDSSGKALFSNCVIATPTTGSPYAAGASVEFMACAAADGSNGADILSYYYEDNFGAVQDNQTVYKATGGAQGEQDDGTDTPYSLQMDPSADVDVGCPLYTPWVYVLVGSTGSKTVAMKVAHTEAAVLTDGDIFMEVEYMGEPGLTGTQRVANSPMSVIEVDDDCPTVTGSLARDVLPASAANRTDDGVDDWTGLTGEKEHTLTASVTCDEVGYIRCRVGLTKDTANPVYVDPKISVT